MADLLQLKQLGTSDYVYARCSEHVLPWWAQCYNRDVPLFLSVDYTGVRSV